MTVFYHGLSGESREKWPFSGGALPLKQGDCLSFPAYSDIFRKNVIFRAANFSPFFVLFGRSLALFFEIVYIIWYMAGLLFGTTFPVSSSHAPYLTKIVNNYPPPTNSDIIHTISCSSLDQHNFSCVKARQSNLQRSRLITAFIAVIFLAVIALIAACKHEPDNLPPSLDDITVAGAGEPTNGKYTINNPEAEIYLGGNTEQAGYTYTWTYVTTPEDAINKSLIFNPSTTDPNPRVSGFKKGVEYTLVLTVKNQAGLTSAKNVTLTVPPNSPPTANAGQNQTVTLASDLTVILNGSGSDDGHIVSSTWTCSEYAPAQGVTSPYTKEQVTALIQTTSENASAVEATVALRKVGTYKFQFAVMDDENAPDIATVTVIVEPMELEKKIIGITPKPLGTNPTVIDLNFDSYYEAEGGWDNNYSPSDIRFEIDVSWDDDTKNSKLSDGIITFDKATALFGENSWPWPSPLFTQTFYDNANNELGKYSFRAGDSEEVGHFDTIDDVYYQNTTSLPPSSASDPLNLPWTLKGKYKTELPEPEL